MSAGLGAGVDGAGVLGVERGVRAGRLRGVVGGRLRLIVERPRGEAAAGRDGPAGVLGAAERFDKPLRSCTTVRSWTFRSEFDGSTKELSMGASLAATPLGRVKSGMG